MAVLGKPPAFAALCNRMKRIKWVVHAKAPFGGPAQVLKYLARYTHRVAISNSRILSIADGKVTFLWKDYADGSRTKPMTLDAVEFIRRFLLHILPAGFVRIRQFGFWPTGRGGTNWPFVAHCPARLCVRQRFFAEKTLLRVGPGLTASTPGNRIFHSSRRQNDSLIPARKARKAFNPHSCTVRLSSTDSIGNNPARM